MAKVSITYDTENEEERTEYRITLKAVDMRMALVDLATLFREWDKYGGRYVQENNMIHTRRVKEAFWDVLNEYGIDPLSEP
jgi:hypothetical protein